MAMKLMLLAFAFVLVVATRVSSMPAHPPMTAPPPVPIPRRHIAKHCAVNCVKYCATKPGIKSKRSCQKVCSLCCDKCNCIPTIWEPKCKTWDKVMYHGVQVVCP